MIRIQDILIDINGYKTKVDKKFWSIKGDIPIISQDSNKLISGFVSNNDFQPITDFPVIVFGDHSCNFKFIDFNFVRGADGTQLLKPNSNYDINFFYYLLQNIRKDIPNLNKYQRHFKYLKEMDISNYKFNIDNQKKIALILLNLDSKIELNNKIILELEEISKTLYNYWFVQFDFPDENGKPYKNSGGKMVWSEKLKREIPEKWQGQELDYIVSKTGTGLNPRQNFKLGNGDNYYITIKNVKGGKILFTDSSDRVDDEALKIIDKRSDLQAGDILFTSIEPVGVTYLIHEKPTNWNINESVFTIRPDYEKVSSEYLYMLLGGEEMKAFTKNVSAGSIHKGIRHGVLRTFKLPYCDDRKVIDNFTKKIKPILKKINLIDKENHKLEELRDWLLPMLMNGQVSVK